MKRNTTIDVAKGVAICLMVIGHCYSSENLVLKLIYAFHMPFFFIVSGILYAEKWSDGVAVNVWALSKKLLMPYLIFDSLFYLFILILQRSQSLACDFAGNLFRSILPLIGTTATWFLPCQLFVVLLAALLIKLFPKRDNKWGGLLFAVIYIIAIFAPFTNRYLLVIRRILIGMGFFAVGYYAKPWIIKPIKHTTVAFCGMTFVILAVVNGMVSLVKLDLADPVLYTLNGCLGTYTLYQVCLLPKNKQEKFCSAMTFFGKNTAIILCTHMFVVEIIRLADYKLFENLLYNFGVFEGFVFGGIVLAVMALAIRIINRYFWYLFGAAKKG